MRMKVIAQMIVMVIVMVGDDCDDCITAMAMSVTMATPMF